MKLRMEVGLGCGHSVLDAWISAPAPKGHSAQFSAHVSSGQMAGWIKVPLGMEIGLGSGDIVLDGDQLPLSKKGGTTPPNLWPMYCG